VLTNETNADVLRARAEHEAGLVLGIALGGFEGQAFRIGHMGHLNPPMLLGTLGTIEAVLLGMGAPVGGSGVGAAAAHIASFLDSSDVT
jgi:alanine-glyoxylate transaminase/serine-glyoxylate transaminase/serine-pyruvate transaminase